MDALRRELAAYGQQHLLQFWDQLSAKERDLLHRDIMELNLAEVNSYFERATQASSCLQKGTLDDKISPIPKECIRSVKTTDKEQLMMYKKLGLREIADSKVAVVLMAGGQGSRLGVSYPKGMYNVGLPSGKTLFQLQAERIVRLQNLAYEEYGKLGRITWYILTSEATRDATLNFLKEHNYFQLNEEDVIVFDQSMIPCFTFEGKIILDEKYKVSKAPDGNGGLYRALKAQGILDDMIKRGIRSVHVHSVDNILIKVADPIFIGYCLSTSTDCGVKVIEKSSPNEAVGVVCKVEDTYQVVEYSEISKETAELRYENGQLIYNAANICNHYFSVDFLCSVGDGKDMQLHVAKKKIPYVDGNGVKQSPTVPNGIKIEKFVFDVFKFAKRLAVWEGSRDEDFSPLKNADSAGQDCPSTARSDLLKLHRKWLLNAGAVRVTGDVEISPLLSYAGENLTRVEGESFDEGPCILE